MTKLMFFEFKVKLTPNKTQTLKFCDFRGSQTLKILNFSTKMEVLSPTTFQNFFILYFTIKNNNFKTHSNTNNQIHVNFVQKLGKCLLVIN